MQIKQQDITSSPLEWLFSKRQKMCVGQLSIYCDQIPEIINLKRGKVNFGSSFWSFSLWLLGPNALGSDGTSWWDTPQKRDLFTSWHPESRERRARVLICPSKVCSQGHHFLSLGLTSKTLHQFPIAPQAGNPAFNTQAMKDFQDPNYSSNHW